LKNWAALNAPHAFCEIQMTRMKSQLSLASGTEVKRLLRWNLILRFAIIALETITLFGFTMTESSVASLHPPSTSFEEKIRKIYQMGV
jgi:hypothetical protein